MSIFKERSELFESFIQSVSGDEPSANVQGKNVYDKDVSALLLNDLETKMIEILQEAKKNMRHSKRHVLTTQDIDASFEKLTIKATHGYPSSVPMSYLKTTTDNQNLWFPKPQCINLKDYISRPKFEQASLDLSYSKHMTAIDGV